jgi:hypothetical protein
MGVEWDDNLEAKEIQKGNSVQKSRKSTKKKEGKYRKDGQCMHHTWMHLEWSFIIKIVS